MTTRSRGSGAAPSRPTPAPDGELKLAARLGSWLFRHRGVLPVPFVAVPFIWPGEMAPSSWALGLLLVSFGESLRLWGVAAAGAETRRRSRMVRMLVTHGPFAWMRNPLYLGNFVIWTGFSVVVGIQWFLPVAAAVFAMEYTPIVRYEEAVLESTFSDEYRRYKERTPRWLPVPPASAPAGHLCWRTAWRSECSTLVQFAVLVVVLAVSQVAR